MAHVDFAGDSLGDQRGAVFFEFFDSVCYLSRLKIKSRGYGIKKVYNFFLFTRWWKTDPY